MNIDDDFPMEACKRFLEHQFGPDLVLPIYKFIDIPSPKTNAQLIGYVDRWMDDPTSFVYHIGCWDTSKVTDFSRVFDAWRNDKMKRFDEVLNWNFSNAVNMQRMFCGCREFKGLGADQWDVSNVTNMRGTFAFCTKFNGDVSGWNVSNVRNMSHTFHGCKKFNGDVSGWNVSSATDMSYLFSECYSFNCDLSAWDVSNVFDVMDDMFYECRALLRKPIWYSQSGPSFFG